jgi:acetyl esterase
MEGAFPPFEVSGAVAARANMEALPGLPGDPVYQVVDRRIDGPGGEIPLRVYRPGPGTRAVIVFFHGGGWAIGNLESHDALCRSLANATGAVVVAVDYRLAPEHIFPAAADDSLAATKWVAEHSDELDVDPGRLAVMGDSAGGNLAAVVSLMARDSGGPAIAVQVGLYPVTSADLDRQSYVDNGTGYFLTRATMEYFWDLYVPDEGDRSNPYAAPLAATDLSGLPPSHIITAEHDPLRDEGEAYANALREAGVTSTNTRYGGMFHGFINMASILPPAAQALNDVASLLRQVLETEAVEPPESQPV